jgi:hypothetical protein
MTTLPESPFVIAASDRGKSFSEIHYKAPTGPNYYLTRRVNKAHLFPARRARNRCEKKWHFAIAARSGCFRFCR